MRRILAISAMLFGLYGVSMAGDRVYFGISLGYNVCPEERVVNVDRRPDVIVVRPTPVYYYEPYERVVIIEKKKHKKHWKKHWHWDDD